MYSVQEIGEEQERQYNKLMKEDDQYCHPESFKWGFEHGFEYALSKLGWHPASELPRKPANGIGKIIVITFDDEYGINNYADGLNLDNIKWWCYPPKED